MDMKNLLNPTEITIELGLNSVLKPINWPNQKKLILAETSRISSATGSLENTPWTCALLDGKEGDC